MADQIQKIANRLAVALSHHIKGNETLDLAQTHYLEEELVDTLYEELAEVGLIPKNSCDEPLFGTRGDSEEEEVIEHKKDKVCLLDFLSGNYNSEPAVKDIIKREYSQDFIDGNGERWAEIGLEW